MPGTDPGDHLRRARDLPAHPPHRGNQLGHGVLGGHRIIKDRGVHPPDAADPPAPRSPQLTCRIASFTRCGRVDRAIRRRQYTNLDGSNPSSSNDHPHATFHRRSQRTASAHSRSDNPCNACNVNTAAIRVAGNDGRPPAKNKSA